MAETSIEWATHVWNPTTGCDRVSEGCDHCYALTLANRLKAMGNPRYQVDGDPRTSGPGFGLTLHWDKLEEPLHWRDPRRVFVNSMSDLFHDDVPVDFIGAVFDAMEATPVHTFMILTKRPGRMASILARVRPDPLPNVWLGTSVESQKWAGVRIPKLLATPAAIRFLSCEPLLGPVDLEHVRIPHGLVEVNGGRLPGIDWVIVGGESGPGARTMDPEWARILRDQCVAASVAFFFKQWGGRTPKAGGRELDGREWNERPLPELGRRRQPVG
jgi:protein gp37